MIYRIEVVTTYHCGKIVLRQFYNADSGELVKIEDGLHAQSDLEVKREILTFMEFRDRYGYLLLDPNDPIK